MIRSYMKENNINAYIDSQVSMLENAVEQLDTTWAHSDIIRSWCEDTISFLKTIYRDASAQATSVTEKRIEKKTEKYAKWVEAMRLAFFQYGRFTEKKSARSEALYATLLSLAATWKPQKVETIIIPGCGPGRSVLDFARVYPDANVIGLDYSALSLMLGEQIVCSDKMTSLLQRDVYGGAAISKEYTIKGFQLGNASFGIIDLITCQLPKGDMIICSNTVNLLPDHEAMVQKLVDALNPGGVIVFADLIGWRLDREAKRRVLCDDASIRATFEKYGMETLDMFSGVPYIEAESDDQETCYNEHFYVGRKKDDTI